MDFTRWGNIGKKKIREKMSRLGEFSRGGYLSQPARQNDLRRV